MASKTKIVAGKSSGNVFADLGFPNPKKELLKAHLTLEIHKIITERNLTQAQAGEILGVKQPHVSALMNARAGSFSVEKLLEFLTKLDRDVEITVRPKREDLGKVSVILR